MQEDILGKRIWMGLIWLTAWFAVIAQFFIAIDDRVESTTETVIRFFSFFTIESNGLIAVAFTFLLLTPGSPRSNFFGRPTTMAAMTVYILVVGITYNLVLRSLWNPEGLQWVVDELLHSVMPLLVLAYWWFYRSWVLLRWSNIFTWLIFPLLYCVYTLIRGHLSGYYPYPFMNVDRLGMGSVMVSIGGMIILFVVLSLALVGISKIRSNR